MWYFDYELLYPYLYLYLYFSFYLSQCKLHIQVVLL